MLSFHALNVKEYSTDVRNAELLDTCTNASVVLKGLKCKC